MNVILIAEASSIATLCNVLKVKHKGHFTFESVIDSLGAQIIRILVVAGMIAEVLFPLFFICNAV